MNGTDAEWEEFKRSLTTLQKTSSVREQLNVLSAQLNEIEQDTKVLPELKEAIEADEASEENDEVLQNEDPATMMQGAMGGGMPPMGGGMPMPEEEQAPPEDERASIGKADLAGGVDSTGTEPVADAVNMDTGDDKVQALFEQLIAALSESSHQALDAGDVGKLMKLTNAQANLNALLESIVPLLASVPENELGGGEPVAKSEPIQKKKKVSLNYFLERAKNQSPRNPNITPSTPQYPEHFPAPEKQKGLKVNRDRVNTLNNIQAREKNFLPIFGATESDPTGSLITAQRQGDREFLESLLANAIPDTKYGINENFKVYTDKEDTLESTALGLLRMYAGVDYTPETLRQAIAQKIGSKAITERMYREALHQIVDGYIGKRSSEAESPTTGRTKDAKSGRRLKYQDQDRFNTQNNTYEDDEDAMRPEFHGLPKYSDATTALRNAKKVKNDLRKVRYSMTPEDKFENYVLPNLSNKPTQMGRFSHALALPKKINPESMARFLSSFGKDAIRNILRGVNPEFTDDEIDSMNPQYDVTKRVNPQTGRVSNRSIMNQADRERRVKDLTKELEEFDADQDYTNSKAKWSGVNSDSYFADLEKKAEDRDIYTGLMSRFAEEAATLQEKLKDPGITPEEKESLSARLQEFQSYVDYYKGIVNSPEYLNLEDIDSERDDFKQYQGYLKRRGDLESQLNAAKAYMSAGKTPEDNKLKAQKLFDYLSANGIVNGNSLDTRKLSPYILNTVGVNTESPEFFQEFVLDKTPEYQKLNELESSYRDFVGYVKSLVGSDPDYAKYYATDENGNVLLDDSGKPVFNVEQKEKYDSVYDRLENDLAGDPVSMHILETCRSKGIHPIRCAEAMSLFHTLAEYHDPDETHDRGSLSPNSYEMIDEAAEILAKPWSSQLPVRYLFNTSLADNPLENLNTKPLLNIKQDKQGKYDAKAVSKPRLARWVTNQGLNGPARVQMMDKDTEDIALNSPLLRKLESENIMDFLKSAAPVYTEGSDELLGELAPYMKRYMEATNTNPQVGPTLNRRKRESALDQLMADLSEKYDDLQNYDPLSDQGRIAREMEGWQKAGYTYDTLEGDNRKYAKAYQDWLRLHSTEEDPHYIYATKTPSSSGSHYNYEFYDSEEAWKDSGHPDTGGKFTDMGYSGKISSMPGADHRALNNQQIASIPVESSSKFNYTDILGKMTKRKQDVEKMKNKQKHPTLRSRDSKEASSKNTASERDAKSEEASNKEQDMQQAIASGKKKDVLNAVNNKKKEDKKDGDKKSAGKD